VGKEGNYMKSVFILMLLLSGCGKPTNVPNSIDPSFQPLYNQFISQANAAGLNLNANQGLTIQFTALEQATSIGEIVGECSSVGWGGGTINIDPGYWNSTDALGQELLMYHELGHCILDEIHTTNRMAIMNAMINNPQYFDQTDMAGMINQLFLDEGDGKS
jgi:hypothetical protein